ncbi:MAG: hypothetical protein KBT34_04830 [Prevotella sp.]|nr:hypothetical protein [Candidatus Prevotella equi]
MFSKELENLIQASLEDGKLDEIEKTALIKRAQTEGVDLTELEIHINSLLQKRLKELNAKEDEREQERLNHKKKEIGKVCPHCGTPIPPMAEKCPSCGMVIITAAVNEAIEREMKAIREKLADSFAVKLEKNSDKNKALGLAQDAKSRLLKLTTQYSTVPQVQSFSALMMPEINSTLDYLLKSETTEHKNDRLGISLLIGLAILFALMLLLMN